MAPVAFLTVRPKGTGAPFMACLVVVVVVVVVVLVGGKGEGVWGVLG